MNPEAKVKGRVFNYSSLPVLVFVDYDDPIKADYRAWYRLAAGCETPSDFPVKLLMPSRGAEGDSEDATILGVRVWNVDGCVVHVIDDPPSDPSQARVHGRRHDIPVRIVGAGSFSSAAAGETFINNKPDIEKIRDLTLVPRRPWVTILGAGVAGLTAAHELIERGFQVQVVEKSHGSPVTGNQPPEWTPAKFGRGLVEPDIGGIARTQWSTAPMDRNGGLASILTEAGNRNRKVLRDKTLRRTNSVHGDGDWYGSELSKWPAPGRMLPIPFNGNNELKKPDAKTNIAKWLEASKANATVAALQIVVVIYRAANNSAEGAANPSGPAGAYARLREFTDWLDDKENAELLPKFLEAFPVSRMEVDGEAVPTDKNGEFAGLLIRYHDQLGLIAGEHGFRFFPGFYRHLRDTMKRTPIYDPVDRRFTTSTVHDNLTEVSYQTIEDPTRRHGSSFLRKKFSTVGAMVNQYVQLRADLGYRASDLLRFVLRMTRYATSSSERRQARYEDISWWDFLSVRHLGSIKHTALAGTPEYAAQQNLARLSYGERFARAIKHSPEALVAMKSEQADARTQGNISIQLALDQFNLHPYTDSTLTGPTSESWFRHWREYLKQQGVRFYVGEVTSITHPSEPFGGPDAGVPRGVQVSIAFPGGKRPASFFSPLTRRAEAYQAHYYVCAMDAVSVKRVTTGVLQEYGEDIRTLRDITELVSGNGRDPESLTVSQDMQLPYQTLTGIQLYYLPRISFDAAHVYYADSAWGLSAVSQIQYWGPVGTGGRHSKLLGNLSIDIGSWRPRTEAALPPTASPRQRHNSLAEAPDPSACTWDELAKQVLVQVNAGRTDEGPAPSYFHIDDYIQFARFDTQEKQGLFPKWNRSPFLINEIGGWHKRPRGKPWSPTDRRVKKPHVPGLGSVKKFRKEGEEDVELVWQHDEGGYEVYFSNLVFAGTHMRTFTRLGTMESANESARHAVNAILDHLTWRECSDRGALPIDMPHVNKGRAPDEPRETDIPEQLATPFGDYCDAWDVEQNEFDDLEFLKLIDKHLFNTKKTHPRSDDDVLASGEKHMVPAHLFDLLGLDRLPDLIDNDDDAKKVFDLLRTGLKHLQDNQSDDLASVLANIEAVKKFYSTFKLK